MNGNCVVLAELRVTVPPDIDCVPLPVLAMSSRNWLVGDCSANPVNPMPTQPPAPETVEVVDALIPSICTEIAPVAKPLAPTLSAEG
jgi:hypothetical protein